MLKYLANISLEYPLIIKMVNGVCIKMTDFKFRNELRYI